MQTYSDKQFQPNLNKIYDNSEKTLAKSRIFSLSFKLRLLFY